MALLHLDGFMDDACVIHHYVVFAQCLEHRMGIFGTYPGFFDEVEMEFLQNLRGKEQFVVAYQCVNDPL